jgi:5-methylcytosine-specific restriction enzyme A
MKGQVYTVAKLHYFNGAVYFIAERDITDLSTLAENYEKTTISGRAKHPKVRVRTLVRLAEGLGLVELSENEKVKISDLGMKYYKARSKEKWEISDKQGSLLRDYILSNPSRTPVIHCITSLYYLVKQGLRGEALSHQYAIAIEKENAWQADVTYEDFTKFGLDYLRELGLLNNTASSIQPSIKIPSSKQVSSGNTFLFTWNPSNWEWSDISEAVYEANVEGKYLDRWSCGSTRKIFPGDRVFLMRLGVAPKGIIGSGVIVSEPFEDIHWNKERASKGDTAFYVNIIFDILSEEPILSEEDLSSNGLATHNWFPQASATHITHEIAEALESKWSKATQTTYYPPEPDEIPHLMKEGTKKSKQVTIYERNPKAREECIKHNGSSCMVCKFSFNKFYGKMGIGFIHVHHVVPVSGIKEEYKIDPINDLKPVCPNCHAMLHKKTPPYSIEELKEKINEVLHLYPQNTTTIL